MLRLTPVSHIVLGLVHAAGSATPYDLKRAMDAGIGDFWSVTHAQLYSEPGRLAGAGLLDEEVEEGGRRRKTYRVTESGEEALQAWLAEPAPGFTELRDPGLLKLWFGADPGELAASQLEIHQRKLEEYEAMVATIARAWPAGAQAALQSGIGHEREWVRFWSDLAGTG